MSRPKRPLDPLVQRAEADRAKRPADERVVRVERRSPAAGAGKRPAPAKETAKRPSPATPAAEPAEEYSTDRYVWFSLALIFLSGYLLISILSYFTYWQADQSLTEWGTLFRNVQQDALNWGGRLGALLSETIVGRWFGVTGVLLPILLLLVAIRLLRVKSVKLRKIFYSLALLMVVGSIAAGQLFGADPDAFGSSWGGAHGLFSAQWLAGIFGNAGATLLVVVVLAASLYYAFGRSVERWRKQWKAFRARQAEKRRIREFEARQRHAERLAAAAAGVSAPKPPVASASGSESPLSGQPTAQPAEENTAPLASFTAPSAPVEEPSAPAQPLFRPTPTTDPTRLVRYGNGTMGYLAGYDAWGNPVVYSVDWEGMEGAYLLQGPQEEESPFTLTTHAPAPMEPAEVAAMTDGTGPAVSKKQHLPEGDDPSFVVEQSEEEQLDDTTVNRTQLYDPTLELSHYRKPPVELMDDHSRKVNVTDEELVENKNRILRTLDNFGIKIDTIEATIGPTVTLYEIVPAPGVRISKIKNLEDDIALSLSALGIRIIAPIPGKGTIGIEVPNKEKEVVSMYSVIKSPRFHDSDYDLPVALGKTIQNETFVFDLAKMPHLLVAGATGQGKSVGLNAIITSLLYKKHPAEIKFVLVDPKKVELTLYQRLEKHFLAKMEGSEEAIITDTQKVIYTLNSLCIEMDARYDLLKAAKVRNIKEYNDKFINRHLNPEKGHRYLPYFVVIVDEFADLIMTAGREIETPIARIAQLARAVGIHLIIATQRPTTNIITGVIKANFPARIAFRVSSMIDSRTILDQPGANQLIGRGDMLFSSGSDVTRVQCAFIDTPEVERITDHIGNQQGFGSAYALPEYTPESENGDSGYSGDVLAKRDPLFEEVAHYIVSNQQGSASTIQRKFAIGFNRAGRIVDQLEAAGIVGRADGSKPRQVLISDPVSLDNILSGLN